MVVRREAGFSRSGVEGRGGVAGFRATSLLAMSHIKNEVNTKPYMAGFACAEMRLPHL